jgi:two-component system, chemotaxis family, sensor kinase Cph1
VTSNGAARILAVDDHRENLAAVEAVLAPLGHDVVTADSGEEALRYVLRDDFAVILMDVRMPTMDGFETVELMKRRRRNEDTAVIFLTGVEKDAPQVFRGYSAGAVDYISKPVDSDVLRSKVAVLVDLYRKTAALKESEERFRTAFANAPIGIALIAPDGEWLQANQALCYMLGRSPAELFKQPICEYTCPEDRPRERRKFQRVIAEKPRFHQAEKRLVHSDGRIVRTLVSVSLAVDGQGKPLNFIWQLVDVSELERRAAELERSNAELERFGSIAAHDLSEPLRVISGFAELVQRRYPEQLDEEGNRLLHGIADGSARMQKLIDDLLAYAKAGRETSREPVACGEVVEQTLATLAQRIEETEAVITVDSLPTVEGDPTQLGQLFQNLIGNALKFTNDARPEVQVSAEREEAGWRFSVRDNGPGIDPQHAELIFEPFRRLHHRDDFPGTGIGLAIAARIVEIHGGRIWVEALPGGGSDFTFTIANHGTRRG